MQARKYICLLLTLVLILGLFAGCGKEEGTTTEVKPSQSQTGETTTVTTPAKYAYKAKYLKLTTNDGSELDYVDQFCVSGNMVYYAASYIAGQTVSTDENGEPILDENGEPFYYGEYKAGLFQMDLTSGQITLFSGYEPAAVPEGMEGDTNIVNIFPGADGTIWVMETTYTYFFDLPENFDEQTEDRWDYYTDSGRIHTMSQYDSQGQKLNAMTLPIGEDVYISYAMADDEGNFLLCDWQTIYVFDAQGNQSFSIPLDHGMNEFIRLNGQIGVTTWNDEGMVFVPVDMQAKALGKEIKLQDNAYNLFSGTGEYTYLYRDSDNIYGYKEQEDTVEKLLSWLDCDVDGSNIEYLTFLDDGRLAALERNWSGDSIQCSLILLEQVDASTLPQKQTMTLGCMGLSSQMRTLIVQFNRTHEDVRIVVEDYSELTDNGATYADALQKLNTQILSGNMPDLLCMSSLPVSQYAGKGLLMDLWPLIDGDAELSREDLMTHLFDAMSTDGKLYQITDAFAISTAAVRTEIAGDRTSWTVEELMEALNQLEPGATILGDTVTKSDMLTSCLNYYLNDFVDWTTGQCSFDSQQFLDILNFVNSFSESYDWESYDWETAESEYSLLQNRKQLMTSVYLADFQELQVQPALHGGDITYIGFPTASGSGSCFQLSTTLAISADCADPQTAWSFARELLLAENQNDSWQFPSNKQAFEAKAQEAMKADYTTDPETGEQVELSHGGIGYGNDFMIELYATTQAQYDALMDLYERTQEVYSYDTSLLEIVTEECGAFFAGQKTAEETAQLIQNRVSLYVAERM